MLLMTKTACRFALAAVAVCSAFAAETRFEISYPAGVNKGPITGRVFIMISRSNDREPRLQISRIGVPFFGRDIERLLVASRGGPECQHGSCAIPEMSRRRPLLVGH